MKTLMIIATIVAEVSLFIGNVAMAEAWQITGDAFYYVLANLMLMIAFGLIGSWLLVIKYEKQRKARE